MLSFLWVAFSTIEFFYDLYILRDLIGCEVVNVASAKLRFKHGLCGICRTWRGNLKGSQTLVHISIGWGTRIKMDRLVHTNNAIQPILSPNAQILKCRIDWYMEGNHFTLYVIEEIPSSRGTDWWSLLHFSSGNILAVVIMWDDNQMIAKSPKFLY